MTSQKLVAVFTLTHPWMQEKVLKAAPPQFEVLFLNIKDEGAARKLLPRADFLMTMKLPSTYLPLLKKCKLVQLHGVGYDGVDTEGLARLGIPIAACPEGTITGVAEHTVLLILALYKQLVRVHESMREGKYDSMAWRPGSHLLFGKTLGIVGLGRAGRRVSHVVRGFDITLIYYDPVRAPATVEEELGATFASFDELLSPVRHCFRAHAADRRDPGTLWGPRVCANEIRRPLHQHEPGRHLRSGCPLRKPAFRAYRRRSRYNRSSTQTNSTRVMVTKPSSTVGAWNFAAIASIASSGTIRERFRLSALHTSTGVSNHSASTLAPHNSPNLMYVLRSLRVTFVAST